MKMLFLDIVWPLYLADGSLIHRHELVSNLAKLGNEIHIFTTDSSTLSNLDNIRCHYICPGSLLTLTLNYFRSSAGLVGSETFDVLYTRNPNFGFLAGFFCKSRCKTLVYELNGIPEDESSLIKSRCSEEKSLKEEQMVNLSRYFSSAKASLKVSVLKKALGFSDKVIAVTPGIKANLESSYNIPGEKITVVSNGANTSLFKPLEQEACRKELGLDAETPYICFVGNLAPWQGVEYLVKAASSILSRSPECRFLIVGDGVMKEELLNLSKELGVADRFVFTGVVSYDRVPVYINASDICAAPFIPVSYTHLTLPTKRIV
ncbi:glycosyltransferase family 4 protein [Methanosarcina sp. 2.H.T.1A.15]|uniref:glycosyltransferase family 4 protein n=1 Tax=Methanosarcina sp. 2.H.T.1A.15 TaxID=1483596 RepID=UPI000621B418|nr:glycosyltransferase family 4 protein [Methanosarcina sp. 2.H.T.1A.15]KKG12758.1 glycosyl transferase [Methanosarcina sp. 2.H.T.1A.15]